MNKHIHIQYNQYTICTLGLGEPDDEELEASSMNYIHQNMSLLL